MQELKSETGKQEYRGTVVVGDWRCSWSKSVLHRQDINARRVLCAIRVSEANVRTQVTGLVPLCKLSSSCFGSVSTQGLKNFHAIRIN